MRQLMGSYYGMLKDRFAGLTYPLSFLNEKFNDVDEWRLEAREEVKKLLLFTPPDIPLDTNYQDSYLKDGVEYAHISYAQPYGPRTEGIITKPQNARGKLPGVVALHDHSGYKYYGKEKITAPNGLCQSVVELQRKIYGGRAWAHELAKRGYVVFTPDVFLWGSRKIEPDSLPEWYTEGRADFSKPVGSEEYIEEFNKFARFQETDIAKALTEAGMTWPGLMLYDDMRAVDFLLTLPETDADNIGCCGLSGGGLRAVFLAGIDERVKASVCAGFMSTAAEFAPYKAHRHTWMMYLPGLTALMDFPDLYALRGRKPTMVQYDIDDELFTPKGMKDADERLTALFTKMGAPDLYSGQFYPGPHKFDVPMQERAFDFFDKWLKG
jgi:dienelactone hydrolase